MVNNNDQGSCFIQAFGSFDTDSKKTDPASSWTRAMMEAMLTYLAPFDDYSKVIPDKHIPTEAEVLKLPCSSLLDERINETFILDPKKIATIKGARVRSVLTKAYKLLTRDEPAAKDETLLAALKAQDKNEAYSDALLRSLLECLGVDDPAKSSFLFGGYDNTSWIKILCC